MSTVLDNDTSSASLDSSERRYGTMKIPKSFLEYHNSEALTSGRICCWPEQVGSTG